MPGSQHCSNSKRLAAVDRNEVSLAIYEAPLKMMPKSLRRAKETSITFLPSEAELCLQRVVRRASNKCYGHNVKTHYTHIWEIQGTTSVVLKIPGSGRDIHCSSPPDSMYYSGYEVCLVLGIHIARLIQSVGDLLGPTQNRAGCDASRF